MNDEKIVLKPCKLCSANAGVRVLEDEDGGLWANCRSCHASISVGDSEDPYHGDENDDGISSKDEQQGYKAWNEVMGRPALPENDGGAVKMAIKVLELLCRASISERKVSYREFLIGWQSSDYEAALDIRDKGLKALVALRTSPILPPGNKSLLQEAYDLSSYAAASRLINTQEYIDGLFEYCENFQKKFKALGQAPNKWICRACEVGHDVDRAIQTGQEHTCEEKGLRA